MILKTVYTRFYRAFNFDYLRPYLPASEADPWDVMEDDTFYPYISLDLDKELTSIVGANESGKSQLLRAIEFALGDKTPTPADFCRYSVHFTVAEEMKLPHFGLRFFELTQDEQQQLGEVIPDVDPEAISSFRVFRTHLAEWTVYLNDSPLKHRIQQGEFSKLRTVLPKARRIDPKLAIPNSVPISFLADGGRKEEAEPGPKRTDRLKALDNIVDVALKKPSSFDLKKPLSEVAPNAKFLKDWRGRQDEDHYKELDLAFDLLVTVSGVQTSVFKDLREALRHKNEGLANGIVDRMNRQIERHLNLAKWWSQDSKFQLAITVRDFDIVFTIKDRTGSQYSFAERSDGLRYFLSYLVQFLTYLADRNGSEILLMDEPDAFLSNQGQQDLLRVLKEFTLRSDDDPEDQFGQVAYVTHSPFLIDRNRADQIRVLDKGSDQEGTRVVGEVFRNHFEPIRTALGGFVGETASMGNCNLILEGPSDQVYIAGMSSLLHREGTTSTQYLNLNQINLIPAGGAAEVPYRTLLALGRAADKPAVIVLLDGDAAGDDAEKRIRHFWPRRKKKFLLEPEYVVRLNDQIFAGLSERPGGPLQIEDLIPLEVAANAIRAYLNDIDADVPGEYPAAEAIRGFLSQETGVFDAVQQSLSAASISIGLTKLFFARHVLDSCEGNSDQPGQEMRDRFAILLSHLAVKQRSATRDRKKGTLKQLVGREVGRFRQDNQRRSPRKVDALMLFERLEVAIDPIEGKHYLAAIREVKTEFGLEKDQSDTIPDIETFWKRLDKLQQAEELAAQAQAFQTTEGSGMSRGEQQPPTIELPDQG